MAVDRLSRIAAGQAEEFERALHGAWEDPWWRRFINLIKERRASFVEALVSGEMDQRSEDRARGQISELNFILSLDLYAEASHGRTERTES